MSPKSAKTKKKKPPVRRYSVPGLPDNIQGKVFPIIRLGHATLQQKAEAVDLSDFSLKQLVADMIATAEDCGNAVGLAAPQIDVSKQVFIFRTQLDMPFKVALNPIIKPEGFERAQDEEGCLSMPGLIGRTPRFVKVSYEYYDLNGDAHTGVAEGYESRVLQHEYDHLLGNVYLYNILNLKDFGYEEEYGNHIRPKYQDD